MKTITSNQKRIITLAILIMVMLVFHLYSHIWPAAPGQSNFMKHVLADLCYIPIIIAAIWFGLRGAVISTTIIVTISLIFILFFPAWSPAEVRSDYIEIIFFCLVGGVSGIALDRDRRLHLILEETERQAAAYNRNLIEVGLDPLVTIGPDGKITDVNKATETATGFSREELIGTDFSDYFTEPLKAREGYQQVFRDGLVRDYPLEIKCSDGRITPVLYNASLFRNENGAIIGIFAAARDITERRNAERALRLSEGRFRTLFEQMLNGFALHEMIFDNDGKPVDYRFLEINSGFEKLTGLKGRDIIGKTVREIIPNIEHFWIERYGLVAQTGEPIQFEGFNEHLGKYYEARAFRPESGKFAVIFDDVTERTKAQKEIEDLARFPKENPGPVLRISSDNMILYANPACGPVLKAWQSRQGGKLPNYVFEIVMEARASDQNQNFEVVCGDKTYWFLINRVSGDQSTSMYGIDVTRRKKAEEALRESQRRLESALKGGDLGLWDLFVPTGETIRSPRYFEILGYEPGEMDTVYPNTLHHIHPDDGPKAAQILADHIEGKTEFYEAEFRARTKLGEWKWVVVRGQAVDRNKQGKALRIVGTLADITKRKIAEEALRLSEERFKVALKTADIVAFNTDQELRYTWMYNPHQDFNVDEVIGKRDDELMPPESAEKMMRAKRKVIETGLGIREEIEIVYGFERIVYDLVAEPLRNEAGEIIGITAASFDITERKKLEQTVWRVNELL
ncbi:MAG TPA: hypothetical protein DCZ43_12360, partial [candidate division Zixibacteria bacterium]|nr:hypothetical protein [candidate division Zixibacteria bacterium]